MAKTISPSVNLSYPYVKDQYRVDRVCNSTALKPGALLKQADVDALVADPAIDVTINIYGSDWQAPG